MRLGDMLDVLAHAARPTRKNRPCMTWKKRTKINKELRALALIKKEGRAYKVTAKGAELLALFRM